MKKVFIIEGFRYGEYRYLHSITGFGGTVYVYLTHPLLNLVYRETKEEIEELIESEPRIKRISYTIKEVFIKWNEETATFEIK